ncbi:MAG: hypothetical protein WKF84_20295 [Pyrinomonadaceae bacterium]
MSAAAPVNRAVYASTAKERRVGRIHDSINLLLCNIANDNQRPALNEFFRYFV